MTITINKKTVLSAALFVLLLFIICYQFYQSYYIDDKIKQFKIKNKFDNIRLSDSLNSIYERRERQMLDSVFSILHKRDSINEIRDRRQDAKIRDINNRVPKLPVL